MEYNGFISTLIQRSETLLETEDADDLNVTRLLLILNAGFTLVRDRISAWDNSDDRGLRTSGLKSEFRKISGSRLDAPLFVKGQQYFEDFRVCDDWALLRVTKEECSGPPAADNIGRILRGRETSKVADLKFDDITRALRNSFAHGGVLPMSHSQAGPSCMPSRPVFRDIHQIDRVYFVSKWTNTIQHPCGHETSEMVGWIVMEFGLDALQAFWMNWRSFILASGLKSISQLDRAA